MRYSLLETMRQFGENQLAAMGESEAARNHHAQYFAQDARANFEIWRSPRQIEAYRWLDREMGNLRAAFRWSVDRGDIETAGNIAANLGDMGLFQLRDEVKLWAAEIVDAARSIRHRRLPMILTWVASAEWYNELRFDTAMRMPRKHSTCRSIPISTASSGPMPIRRSLPRCKATSIYPLNVPTPALPTLLTGRIACARRFVATFCRWPGGMTSRCVSWGPTSPPPRRLVSRSRWRSPTIQRVAPLPTRTLRRPSQPTSARLRSRMNPATSGGSNWWSPTWRNCRLGPGAQRPHFACFAICWIYGRARPTQWGHAQGIGGLIILFERLGLAAQAVTLHAALMHYLPSLRMLEELPTAIERARTALGDAAFDEAVQRGAAMESPDMTEFARAEIAQALSTVS